RSHRARRAAACAWRKARRCPGRPKPRTATDPPTGATASSARPAARAHRRDSQLPVTGGAGATAGAGGRAGSVREKSRRINPGLAFSAPSSLDVIVFPEPVPRRTSAAYSKSYRGAEALSVGRLRSRPRINALFGIATLPVASLNASFLGRRCKSERGRPRSQIAHLFEDRSLLVRRLGAQPSLV